MRTASITIDNAEQAIALGNTTLGIANRKKAEGYSILRNLSWTDYLTGIGAVAALVSVVVLAIFGQIAFAIICATLLATQCVGVYASIKSSLNKTLLNLTERFTSIVNKLCQENPKKSTDSDLSKKLLEEIAETREERRKLSLQNQPLPPPIPKATAEPTPLPVQATPTLPPVQTPTVTKKKLKERRASLPPTTSHRNRDKDKLVLAVDKALNAIVESPTNSPPEPTTSVLSAATDEMNSTTDEIRKLTAKLKQKEEDKKKARKPAKSSGATAKPSATTFKVSADV